METGRMNAAMEADRELLWALLRRRAEELPTVALGAVAATFAELASTTARLLAAGPTHPDEEPLPEADVPRVLAARDAVVGGCARWPTSSSGYAGCRCRPSARAPGERSRVRAARRAPRSARSGLLAGRAERAARHWAGCLGQGTSLV